MDPIEEKLKYLDNSVLDFEQRIKSISNKRDLTKSFLHSFKDKIQLTSNIDLVIYSDLGNSVDISIFYKHETESPSKERKEFYNILNELLRDFPGMTAELDIFPSRLITKYFDSSYYDVLYSKEQ